MLNLKPSMALPVSHPSQDIKMYHPDHTQGLTSAGPSFTIG